MDADKSYSSISVSQRKQRLLALLENRRNGKQKGIEMDADKSYSSMSMSQKKQRLLALLENRRNGKLPMPKKRLKVKKLDAHVYTKYYRISGLKAKVLNRVAKGRIARKLTLDGDGVDNTGNGDLPDTQFENARRKPTRNQFEVEYQDNATHSSQVHKKAKRKRAGTRSPLGNHRSNEKENVAEECSTHPDGTQRALSSLNSTPAARTTEGQPSQTDQPPQTSSSNPLAAEIERIQKECEQLTKSFQEKESLLQSEREKEIAEINKKYDALLLDSKTSFEREIKILQAYQKRVDANKDLAELLEQNWQEQDTPNIKRPQKETSSLNVQEIPASALRRPENRPLLTGGPSTNLPGPSSAGSVFRAPAPHLRTNPTLFASSNNHNQAGTSVPFYSNCPICPGSSQTARPDPSLEFD